ncbi:AraC family transcriptional regulator [uncultured Sunxiuqinia sp.]|uniref:helix-turn-helix domain-containing protein n=1 Tax=uncultured Sunxiuqinia sp. TaxID=1573825 RepID=UPI002633C267|nr:AraC family transcriptional regulator [uncultured Sunxiuqinia sp.]
MQTNLFNREITPLTPEDCLLVFDRWKETFDFPPHFHPEFELNFIQNAAGVKRFVGDHIGEIGQLELVLVGPNQPHFWEQANCSSTRIREITIQFHQNLFHDSLLNKNILHPIRDMLQRAYRGIAFSENAIRQLQPRIENLANLSGMDAFLELLSLLFDLSNSRNQQMLSSTSAKKEDFFNHEKMKLVFEFVQKNYMRKIKVEEMADLLNMTEVSFSRFMKQRTGKTFIEYLNDSRIGFATRYLIENNHSISEIAYLCGFNNLANFNRIFKKRKGSTPSEYRDNFAGIKRVN